MKTTLAGIFVTVLVATAYAGESESRFARMFEIANSPEVVVITEGDFEARSGGSYALRIYGDASHKYR